MPQKPLTDYTLEELAAEMANAAPGAPLHGRYVAEFQRRQTAAMIDSAKATERTAQFALYAVLAALAVGICQVAVMLLRS